MTRPIRRPRPPGILARVEEKLRRIGADGVPADDHARLADMLERVTLLEVENARFEAENARFEAENTRLEAENAELTLARDELQKQLGQREGEVEVLRARLREEMRDRDERLQRVDRLEQELSDLTSDVLAADATRQQRGLFRRTPKAPSPRPSSSRTPPPEDRAPAGAIAVTEAGEDLDSIIERRLFGQ